jgi:hypothetical protein
MPRKIDLNDPRYVVEETPSKINLSDSRFASESQAAKSPSDKQRSPLQSGLIGMAQGATFGFGDEAVARLESIRSGRPYEEVLQESKAMFRGASEQNPVSYIGGEIAGGIAPALVTPVTAPRGLAQATVPLARSIGLGAGTGVLSGLGYSEGETAGEIARDVGIGGALGGALPVVGRGIQSAIQGAKPAIDTSIKSGLSAVTGKTIPYLEKVESQPERIKKIERIFTGTGKEETQKLANDISDLVSKNPFGRKAELLSNRSYKILEKESDNISLPKENVLNNLKNLANDLNTSSDVDELTLRALTKKIKKIDERYPDVLNGMQSKKLIKEIDKDIKALSPKVGEQRQLPIDVENRLNLFKTIRSEIDVPLKTQSPNYAESMKPVADATNVSEYLQRLTVSQYGGKQASAKKAEEFINQKLRQNALTPLEAESKTLKLMQKELENPRYNNYPGIEKLRDVNQTISDLKLLQEIQATGAIGSSVTNRMMGSGAAVGSAIAGTPGTIAGTLGGALLAPRMEREGGRIAAKVLEGTKKIRTPSAVPQSTQRGFAAQQGIQRGLLDEFLNQNKREVERNEFLKQNQNRVK